MNLILFLTAYLLFLPLSLLNYIVVAKKGSGKGYFRSSAVSLDQYGNRELRSLFNKYLITEAGHRFGDQRETISSVLGKNQRDKTLTKTGILLVRFLDWLDRDHCFKSITEII